MKTYGDEPELIEEMMKSERFVLPPSASFYTLYEHRHEPGNGERIDQALHAIEEANGTKLKDAGKSVFQDLTFQEDTGRKNTSNEDKSKYRRINISDIGYNTMRMRQGRSSLSDKEGIVSPAYTILIPGEKVVPAYAAQLFKFPKLIHVFYRHSQGLVSDTWNLKFNHFKKISWGFPCLEEQYRISRTLSSADREIETLQQKLDCLKQEKKALMQQLLTGKRRVQVEETQ